MRKVTTRYVLTINPYQIVRENWVVGKILSLVLSLCFFFKKRAQTAWERPRRDKFCSATTSRSVAKEIWLVENEYILSLSSEQQSWIFFFSKFFFSLPVLLLWWILSSLLRLFCLFLFPLVALCGFFD